MKYKNIFFDLDGTVTDSGPGIVKSVQYALRCYGIDEPDLDKLNSFVGPPLYKSFMNYLDCSEEEAKEAVECYREYYAENGLYDNKLYDGIESLLYNLKEKGYKIILASSKPRIYVKRILSYFRIMRYFDYVEGSELDSQRTDKGELLAYVLKKWDLRPEESVMIGDRKYDIEGAKANGMDSIAVGYGYGSVDELSAAGPTLFFPTIEELKNFF
ncbi:MAG: HAD family hydrolase [Spirochaetia bacterium]|nr:HAD family hydrolase [Spirochaetia bacterium]